MIKQFISREFFIFLLTGGSAAAINYVSRIFYSLWTNFSVAIILAYITGMATSFLLARIFVFKKTSQNIRKMILFFCIVNLITATQTWLISMGLANFLLPQLGINQYVHEIAHAVGLAIPVFTSYAGHKYFSFRNDEH